jgi:dihydroxyacetone kinase-like protein
MTVRAMDDVSMPASLGRRGMSGIFFIIKIAGAACASNYALAAAHAVSTKARDETRSLSVAFRPGSLPETGEPTFSIAEDEIEIGAGGHGERGIETLKVIPADELVDLMLGRLVADYGLARGDRVALLVNNLGATTMMELLIVNRRIRAVLDAIGVATVNTWLGPYVTAQEMAGFSISMLRVDEELERLLSVPSANESFLRP